MIQELDTSPFTFTPISCIDKGKSGMTKVVTPATITTGLSTGTGESSSSLFPASIFTREGKEKMMKWGLDSSLSFNKFKYDNSFRLQTPTEIKRFLMDLFNTSELKSCYNIPDKCRASDVEYTKLTTTVLNMNFFDKLVEHNIVVESYGYIKKCMDEDFKGVLVSDKLREMFANPDSENAYVFKNEEKKEFIYQLLQVLAIGGGMCQPEESIGGYMDMCKLLYKDLCSVFKNSKTGQIEIGSQIFMIDNIVKDHDSKKPYTYPLFTMNGYEKYPYSKCFVIVNNNKREVTLMVNDWKPFW